MQYNVYIHAHMLQYITMNTIIIICIHKSCKLENSIIHDKDCGHKTIGQTLIKASIAKHNELSSYKFS